MASVIRTSASLATSYMDGTTVFEHAPSSRGARDYANATDELLQRLAGETNPGSAETDEAALAAVPTSRT